MAILEALARDHRRLEEILSTLGKVPSSEPEQRLEMFTELQTLLQSHARAEEEVVYRSLAEAQPDEPKLLEAYEEHHIADVLLQEMASACPGGRGWAVKVKVLEELLRHHIKEEEMDLFPLIREAFDEPRLVELEEQFRVLKHERFEQALAPLRRMTPAFAGRALVNVQVAAGRYLRRSELKVRNLLTRLRAPDDESPGIDGRQAPPVGMAPRSGDEMPKRATRAKRRAPAEAAELDAE